MIAMPIEQIDIAEPCCETSQYDEGGRGHRSATHRTLEGRSIDLERVAVEGRVVPYFVDQAPETEARASIFDWFRPRWRIGAASGRANRRIVVVGPEADEAVERAYPGPGASIDGQDRAAPHL